MNPWEFIILFSLVFHVYLKIAIIKCRVFFFFNLVIRISHKDGRVLGLIFHALDFNYFSNELFILAKCIFLKIVNCN